MHLVIVRPLGNVLDVNSYNCQEIGLAKALVNDGWCVSVIMAGLQNEHIRVNVSGEHFVDVYFLRFVGLQSVCLFRGWKRLIKKLKPDIIQVHDLETWMSFRVVRYSYRHRIPCVLIQGACPTEMSLNKRFFKKIFDSIFGKYVLKHVNAVGCKTPTASAYLNEIYPCETWTTPIGLDEQKFAGEVCRDWVAELHLEDKKVLLYVGRLNNYGRKPMFLVDLLRQLPSDYCLVMAGEGILRDDILCRASEYGISDRVHLIGTISQKHLPALYRAAHVFLLPSTYEIYGMVMLVAMYFGVPVISTASAGAKVIIQQDVTGYILDTFDTSLWAEKIVDINEKVQKSMGADARQYIQKNLTWSGTAKKFEELYRLVTHRL